MRIIVFSALLLLYGTCVWGQRLDPGPFTAISAKMLMIDHEVVNAELTDLQKSYAIELGLRRQLRKELGLMLPIRFGNVDVGDFVNHQFAAADLVLRVTPFGTERSVSPYLQGGYGITAESSSKPFLHVPMAFGLDFNIGEDMWFNLQLEYRNAQKDFRDHAVASVGYTYRFGQADRDGDRIPDGRDACPDTPGPSSASGCPDEDRDGVADDQDNCPEEAGSVTANGCPDEDGDGVPDNRDQCPYEAGKKRLRGCPDLDNDGVPDDLDKCPNDPGNLYTGCPDSDNDGFEDPDDECPDIPGKNQGCPEVTPELQARLTQATNQIRFDARQDKITPESITSLNDIYDILITNPGFRLIIEGHTDNTGTEENNQRLSELRALACRGYLISKGIDADRIKVIGRGATRPRADNNTLVGRELNRRVEFSLVVR
ncbi:MAG: OmpA family protein [Bacteroidota bacterium]